MPAKFVDGLANVGPLINILNIFSFFFFKYMCDIIYQYVENSTGGVIMYTGSRIRRSTWKYLAAFLNTHLADANQFIATISNFFFFLIDNFSSFSPENTLLQASVDLKYGHDLQFTHRTQRNRTEPNLLN